MSKCKAPKLFIIFCRISYNKWYDCIWYNGLCILCIKCNYSWSATPLGPCCCCVVAVHINIIRGCVHCTVVHSTAVHCKPHNILCCFSVCRSLSGLTWNTPIQTSFKHEFVIKVEKLTFLALTFDKLSLFYSLRFHEMNKKAHLTHKCNLFVLCASETLL